MTGPIFAMAEILLGFALMTHLVMMFPPELPWGTPKVHFWVKLNVE
jgi:hypothetical protein